MIVNKQAQADATSMILMMIYSLCPRRKTIRQTTHSTRPWRCSIFAPAESCSAGLHINCYASICSNTYLLLLVTFEAETPLSAMLFWMVSRSRWSRILNEIFPWALTGAPLIQSELVSTSPAKFLTNIAICVEMLLLKSCSPDILTLAWILVR